MISALRPTLVNLSCQLEAQKLVGWAAKSSKFSHIFFSSSSSHRIFQLRDLSKMKKKKKKSKDQISQTISSLELPLPLTRSKGLILKMEKESVTGMFFPIFQLNPFLKFSNPLKPTSPNSFKFSHTVWGNFAGKIKNNDTGDVADDHYHRFLEDIELMNSMGMNAYRFSISWTRILPQGRFGKVNKRGVTFYNKIIDHLLLKGIEPFVTIHHHDLPIELDKRYGSWMSSQMQEDFVYFAKICFEEFGDRVKYWMTINEPNLVTMKAYMEGVYPPAHCSPPFGKCFTGNSDVEPLIVVHNMLLAHAKAVRLYRTHFQEKQGGSIGIVACAQMYEPLTDNEFDKRAADRALVFNFAWIYDPIVHGDYPKEMREILGNQLPSFSDVEKNLIRGSLDYICINHYTIFYTKDCLYSACFNDGDRPIKGFLETTAYRDGVPIGDPTGVVRFFVVPRGLEKIINYVKERYPNKPIFVTENGYSTPLDDGNKVEDLVNDSKRVQYHKSYLASLARAMRNGADVRGYFVWSLMDNFEWVDGYDIRFGLLYVDLQTFERRPKLSAQWFASFLGAHQQLAKSSSKLNTNALDSLMDG